LLPTMSSAMGWDSGERAFRNMVIDIGGGTAEIAVIALYGMVCDMSVGLVAMKWMKQSFHI